MGRYTPAILVLTLSMVCLGVREATSAVIPVTTVEQKISATGGCSLQEAIYSANFDNNIAISGYSGSTPVVIVTQCVPGNGDDIIVLPAGALMQLSKIVDDANNPTGPTATPIVTSNITILAYGATLERIGSRNFRLFTVGATGRLTIRRAYVRGFRAQGGKGSDGGGGGMGAGGAIYVMQGTLVIDGSTFQNNIAYGGAGGGRGVVYSGGGGGMGGNGGEEVCASKGGAGGGGARGDGGNGCLNGGGGGTLRSANGNLGGFDCGANGHPDGDGDDAPCAGGGGAGGSVPFFINHDGGRGNYGGGGGGAGLGGAVFNDNGTVDIRNGTFTGNGANGGYSSASEDGSGGGGAIFSVNGRLTILNSTISGNTANFGGGIIVAQDSENAPTSFVLENTIVAGNGQHECAIAGISIGVAFAGNLITSNA